MRANAVDPVFEYGVPNDGVFMIKRIAVSLAALVLLALLGALYFVHRQLPDEQAPPIEGLGAPVTVRFDARGVPTIAAENLLDAFRVQGYLVARERLFQLELQRRAAEGRLAELVGKAALPLDRAHRLYGFRQVAQAAVPLLPPAERAQLAAYAQGINAFIATHHGRWGLELAMMKIEPQPFSEQNALEVMLLMHEDLSSGWNQELRKLSLRALSPSQLRFIEPQVTDRDVLVIPDLAAPPAADPAALFHASLLRPPRDALGLAGGDVTPDTGSNNWVVSGARAKGGKPLLANDPHLGLSAPGLWIPMRIELPGRFIQGVALAGLPGITLGHNDRIAWGFTNLGTDVADLFREPPTGERVEEIAIKGEPSETLRVKLGRHGPQWREGYSLQWAPLDPRNLRSPIAAIDLARDWETFNAAVDSFTGPAQNIVYADIDGHIGYRASGLIPLRPDGDDGSLPRDGTSDWHGFVPQAEMPRVLDPPAGYIATANQRVIGSSFPHPVATDWASPTRARRIGELIEKAGKLDRAGMEAIQLDVVSQDHLELVRFHPDAQRFDGWKGEARAGSLLFLEAYAWETAVRELLRRKVLGALADDFAWSNDSATLRTALAADQAAWTRAGLGDRAQFLKDAAARATAWLAEQHAADWGAFDALHVVHPFGRAGGVLGLLFNPPSAPQSGASRTVRVARPAFGQSMRLVVDFADPLAATLVVPLGVSGHLGSAHRFDQQRDWLHGDPAGERTRLSQPAAGKALVFNPGGGGR